MGLKYRKDHKRLGSLEDDSIWIDRTIVDISCGLKQGVYYGK